MHGPGLRTGGCCSLSFQPPATSLASSCALGPFLILLSSGVLIGFFEKRCWSEALEVRLAQEFVLALVLSFGRLAWAPVSWHLAPLLVPRHIVGMVRALVRQPVGVPCRNCGQCQSPYIADGGHGSKFSHVFLVCPLAHSVLALFLYCGSPSACIRTPFSRLSGGLPRCPSPRLLTVLGFLLLQGPSPLASQVGSLLLAAPQSAIRASSRLVR